MANFPDLDFNDLEPKQCNVTVGGKKYVLKEASGGAVVAWRNAQMKATRIGPNGKPVGVDGLADSEPLLVSMCLYEVVQNAKTGKEVHYPVKENVVRGWPSHIMTTLFETVKKMSGLDRAVTAEQLRLEIEAKQNQLDAMAAEKEMTEAINEAIKNGEEPEPDEAEVAAKNS